jgi:hypothetical protein
MDNAKRCRERAAECLDLAGSAQSETEERLLRSLSQSWVRIANQIERYEQYLLSKRNAASPNNVDTPMEQPGVRALDPTPDPTAPKWLRFGGGSE